MNVREFADLVNGYADLEQYRDTEVELRVIELGSIGPSAAEKVTGLYPGFDWNHGRLFVTTGKQLVRFDTVTELFNRDRARRPLEHDQVVHDKLTRRSTPVCAQCRLPVEMDFKFCPHCGQRLERG